MGSMLWTNPQKKNKLVTSINGSKYLFFPVVMADAWVCIDILFLVNSFQ
jgi:hypothetical protein